MIPDTLYALTNRVRAVHGAARRQAYSGETRFPTSLPVERVWEGAALLERAFYSFVVSGATPQGPDAN